MPLLVCSFGANYFLPLDAYSGLGGLVGSIFDNIDDPPAVLCVKNTRSLEPIYVSFDPDLALVWGFSYPITEKMLRCRAPFVNYHPAPLPLMRGPMPYPRMVLDKSIDLTASWHYMVAKVDHGPIIQNVEIRLLEGKDRDTATGGDILNASKETFFTSFNSCLDLVESGHPGAPQSTLVSSSPGATLLSDEERTIRGDMTVEEALRLNQALDGTLMKPLLQFDGRLYYVIRVSKVIDEGHRHLGSQKRVGSNVLQVFQGGALKMEIRKI